MADLYIVDFAGDPDDRRRREEARAAEDAAVRARYKGRIIEQAGLDDVTAELVLSTLFDHFDSAGSRCLADNHPRLPRGGEYSHDAGFDCPCTWSPARQEAEAAARRRALDELWNSADGRAEQARHDEEQAALAAWLESEDGVVATQTTSCAPEQWEGAVDGHSFYFRERHGSWRIELDLEPDGRFAQRFAGTGPNGEMITEPVELRSGPEIAAGDERDLGCTMVEHISFIVRTIRDHLARAECPHDRAEIFCPACGSRREG